jgi:hypothetical protein
MPQFFGDSARGVVTVPSNFSQDETVHFYEFIVPPTGVTVRMPNGTPYTQGTTLLAVNDTIVLGELPPNCIPTGLEIRSDRLDTASSGTLAGSFGIVNAAGTGLDTSAANGGAAWLAANAATFNTAAGGSSLTPANALYRVAPSSSGRRFGLHITAVQATASPAGAKMTAVLRFRTAL